MSKLFFALCCLLVLSTMPCAAATPLPVKDVAKAQDSPLLGRYEGSFIVSYSQAAFGDAAFPLSPLIASKEAGKLDAQNNRYFGPEQQREAEGKLTRLVYLLPANRSPLEVLRNYQEVITAKGGQVLFQCKAQDCGGDNAYGVTHGGGAMGLINYVFPAQFYAAPPFSAPYCTLDRSLSDVRYFTAEIKSGSEAVVGVMTYTIGADGDCAAFAGRTVAIVNIVEAKAREQKMVVVNAADMAGKIGSEGRVALYGVNFDTNSAVMRPDSAPQLAEIAKLLKDHADWKVIVAGHTDNQGALDYNIELSRKRAQSITTALVQSHGIAPARLYPQGLGMAAPAASNDNEAGRAKNRRVEIVRQ